MDNSDEIDLLKFYLFQLYYFSRQPHRLLEIIDGNVIDVLRLVDLHIGNP